MGFPAVFLPLLVEWQEGHPACKNQLVAPKFSMYFPFRGGILGDPRIA